MEMSLYENVVMYKRRYKKTSSYDRRFMKLTTFKS